MLHKIRSSFPVQVIPNGNFNNFMDIMWKEDYEIMEKSRKNIDGYTRDYSDWENIFNIKNKY